MRLPSRITNERGVALVATLLALLVILGLMAGAFAAINADLRSNAIDRDQSQAYSAAHAGLEKITSDLASLFTVNFSPTVGQINALAVNPPDIPGFEYTAPGGAAGSGYQITWLGAPGAPQTLPNMNITAGPYAGFRGLITPFTMTVTARSTTGGAEVRLRRELNTVAVPVFQFGVFSEGDLTFYAGDDFNFGGRVHTNGHLFLAEATNQRLSFSDRITAVGDVVRQNLSNGQPIANVAFGGTVQILTTPPGNAANGTGYTAMTTAMGSINGMPLGPVTNPPWANPANAIANWPTYSNGAAYFKGNIKNRFTGATILRLPLVSQGANPIDLIRRPVVNSNEDAANPLVFGQRFFAQASVRILLSDRAADITNLPTVTADAPIALDGDWNAAAPAGYAVGPGRPPIARSAGPLAATTLTANPAIVGGNVNNQTLTVSAIPAQFQLPQITVEITPGNFHTTTCSGKTGTPLALNANQFTNCNPVFPALPAVIAAGRPVTATLPSGATVMTTTAAGNVALSNTITVVEDGTAAFAPISFFTTGTASFPTPVSCTGYRQSPPAPAPSQYYGCSWAVGIGQGVAPVNGHAISTHALQNADVGLIGGFIKIERQDHNGGAGGTWTDVTMDVLNLGIGAPNQDGFVCGDPTPDAIVRIQRLKDNAFPNLAAPVNNPSWACPSTPTDGHAWWPQTLYDTREGAFRDVALNAPPTMGGAMQYISLDARNLTRWLNGQIGAAGTTALNRQGFIVYFSDRRGDHRIGAAGEPETGKYGFEDQVNRNQVTGAPNNVLDAGEDVDGWGADNLLATADDEVGAGALDTYARTPWFEGGVTWGGAAAPYNNGVTARHETAINSVSGRANRVVLFRRALKLVAGGYTAGANNLPVDGLTVVAENPVYVQGNYNSNTNPNNLPDDNVAQPNVPAAIIADAITLLSNNWSDARSFRLPNDRGQRDATTTGYRFAAIAGKNVSFPFAGTQVPGGTVALFGTDGGMGNFLRLLEDWNIGGVQINYRGSVVSLYNSRQALGVFKWGNNVYSFGVRNFQFDSDFLVPTLLPPGTPMFRDVNTLNFRQMLRPTQ